ncbi:carbonic anhydrase family protein [Pedobacter sp.]|uniref:carbonic anhydrase family protein n=1 Tax=Pedobacter sp. TaxID=1411316 RepID=UPI003D7FF8BB
MSIFTILFALFLLGITYLYVTKNRKSYTEKPSADGDVYISPDKMIAAKLLTAEQQAALKPDHVLEILKNGNDDFVSGDFTVRRNAERVLQASSGQYPLAVVLSCLDSRVPVEDVFQRGVGDIFVVRVAGNIINEDILGSLEFACKVSGSKVIVVLGHENCGAIHSAVAKVELGNITPLLAKIKPAVTASANFPGTQNVTNPAYLHHVCVENVKNSVKNIRENSQILSNMEASGEIIIASGVYDMESGKVNFM